MRPDLTGNPIAPGALVLVHLVNPSEKYWGVLRSLDGSGLVLTGLSVTSFDDWAREVARGTPETLGLSSLFVPLFRVERLYLDEQVGQVESYAQRFERQTGMAVMEYLEMRDEGGSVPS